MSEELQDIIDKVKPVLQKHKITKSSIFGSFVRGEQKETSDVDILISEFPDSMNLYDLAELKNELEESVKRKVDVVTERSIKHPKLLNYIKKDLVPVN